MLATLTDWAAPDPRIVDSPAMPGLDLLLTGASSGGPTVSFDRGLGVFSVLAHELRVPLNALSLSAELLADDLDVLDRAGIRRMVVSIQREAVWLRGLVENLLCAAALKDGRFRLRREWASLVDVVRDTLPIVEPMLAQQQRQLHVKPRGVVPPVFVDCRRIGQLLVNLISNANSYTAPGLPIDVHISGRPGWVRLSVADRGPGFGPGERRHLFSPFYRSSHAERSRPEGTGLGLAIVRSIVEAHGGRLGAENRRGGGARFWIELPVQQKVTSELRAESNGVMVEEWR